MNKKNLKRKNLVLFLILSLFTFSLFSGILQVEANPDNVYLCWEGDDAEVGGFLTIKDFPAVLEIGKTYGINSTFSLDKLDYADAVEFRRIEWALTTPDGIYTIGYSSLDANLTKHGEISAISHWGLAKKPTSGGGILTAIATIELINSTIPEKAVQTIRVYPPIKITLKVETVLRMYPTFFYVEQGDAITLSGGLESHQGGATITIDNKTVSAFDRPKIDLLFNDPNGNQKTRSTFADNYGNFTYEFKPDVKGMWYVTASYNGSLYFFPSTSNMVTVRVRYQFPWAVLIVVILLLLLLFVPCILKRMGKRFKWNNLPKDQKQRQEPTHNSSSPDTCRARNCKEVKTHKHQRSLLDSNLLPSWPREQTTRAYENKGFFT